MIDIATAKELILDSVSVMKSEKILVEDALGRVTSEAIYAPIDLPLFDVSAMDGFAFCWKDYQAGQRVFTIAEEAKAGAKKTQNCEEQTAIPIYTGAPLPQGADSVVMVEKCTEKGSKICFPEALKPYQHIRKQGEQIKKGTMAISSGFQLNPSALSYLAALGVTHVKVAQLPQISVLTTGDELVPAGEVLPRGSIYESNGMALKKLFSQEVTLLHAFDNKEHLKSQISKALKKSDWLVLTGGISAGKYDLVADCLSELRVKKHFHKVNQKPGKPFYFGTKGEKLVFALPGNPAAVISCFYCYLYPAWQSAQGLQNVGMKSVMLPLKSEVYNKGNRAQVLKSSTNLQLVEVLQGQGSHILHSFTQANCLVELPAIEKQYLKGEKVLTHILPDV